MGAEVVRVERLGATGAAPGAEVLLRSRRSVAVDLKDPRGAEVVLRLAEGADALLEGFRPGVAERLGLGPDTCLGRNPRLVYGRMTGWGQDGPRAARPGHDINYIALAGALNLIGPPGAKPVPPLNLLGDFGGGGMLLAAGVLAALWEAGRSGAGQVVDAAMVDGTVALLAMAFGFRAEGRFRDATGAELLAGAAPYYDTYRTADDRFVAVGALEPPFLAALLEALAIPAEVFAGAGFPAFDAATVRDRWPAMRAALADAFARRTLAEWEEVFATSDACVTPVLTVEEAARHPHNAARGSFTTVDGVLQNAPAPRFGRTPTGPPTPARRPGEDTEAVLRERGFTGAQLAVLRAAGVIAAQ